MKQNSLRRFFATSMLFAITTLTWAYDFAVNGIYYNKNSDGTSVTVTYKTTSYNSYSGSVAIPSQVTYNNNTYDVTSIGESAFRGCSGLTSITIPNSVTSIGNFTFYCCTSLTSVTIPNSVTSIGWYAFFCCTGLTSVTIPNSVTSIRDKAFYGCRGLTSVTIGSSVTSIGEDAFMFCSGLTKAEFASIESLCNISFGNSDANPLYYAKHLYINGQEVTDLVIPNSVTSIGDRAFSGCNGLTSITIPNSVTSIGSSAFYNCSGLTSVTIPNSVTSIGSSAFYGCSGLTSVTIPNSVTSIGISAFSGCSGLTSVTIPNSVTSIGDRAFSGCNGLTSITIPNSVTSIGNTAFLGTAWYDNQPNGLVYAGKVAYGYKGTMPTGTNISLKEGTLGIGGGAFESCTALTSVTIPESVTSIGIGAFYGCTGLTSVTIPNSVTSIGIGAFDYTAWYDNQPNGLVYAGKVAYKYKGTMPTGTNISLEEGTLGIAGYAFSYCSGLTSVTIPNSVTSIGERAFRECSGLTSVTIGNSVTSIGSYAFYGCNGLTSVTIPNSVTRIGNNAFSHCSSLSKIYCYAENVPSTESELIFEETPINSAKLLVPKGSLESYKAFSPWKDFGKVLPYNTTIYYIVDGEIYMQYMIEVDTPITPEPIPTKEGYTFSGWSAIPETMPADDVIVTGTFSINKYTLTYLLNGEVYLTETVVYGTPLEPEPALRREGYTFTGWSTIPETMPASDVIIKGAFYINGDVNTDNEVDVVDVVDIARFVVGTPAITFMEVLADINKDGTVNIGDAVVLVNDIVGNQNFARIQLDTNRDASNNMLTLTRRNGNLSLNLKNESCYSAFQFDLYVPEGMDVSGIMLNPERKHKHQILYNKIEDGHYRIAALSTVNNIFKGHDGELLNITLDEIPDNEISIRKILFFDSEGQSYQFDDIESMIVTQIENLSSTILKEKEIIYDLQARKREKLQRGINIVNGKKIVY